jgi:hypothetical protein
MMAALIATGFWDNLACHLEFPVSTTHTTGEHFFFMKGTDFLGLI